MTPFLETVRAYAVIAVITGGAVAVGAVTDSLDGPPTTTTTTVSVASTTTTVASTTTVPLPTTTAISAAELQARNDAILADLEAEEAERKARLQARNDAILADIEAEEAEREARKAELRARDEQWLIDNPCAKQIDDFLASDAPELTPELRENQELRELLILDCEIRRAEEE